jgi:putative pyruvate formate lyase activating enzyme
MGGLNEYSACHLCPRNCGIDRNTSLGFCGESSKLTAARASLHMWEEPPISGTNGSGTVFFRGCNLKCIYCQNYDISQNEGGKYITSDNLSEIFLSLQKKGAHNINLVTPTHFSPHVKEAVKLSRSKGLNVPVVYNTGGYEKSDVIKSLKSTVDIYLTDFKYIKSEAGKNYSNASDYFEYASSALDEMVSQNPSPVFENGLMKKGVIVRHLLLPGHLIEAKMIVKYIYERYGNSIYISLMNQYTPLRPFPNFSNLERRVTDREYNSLISYASRLGVTNAFVQEGGTAKESFIPAFDLTGI